MVLTDEELIQLYKSDSQSPAAEAHANELLRRYSAKVVNWCWRFAKNKDAASDLAQDVLLKAYRSLPGFRSDAKFSTWLYLIARNHCLNYVRDRGIQLVDMAEPLDMDPRDAGAWDTLARLERESELDQARALVAEVLDETEAKVMMLHYGEELPLDTITGLLGLTNASGAKAYIVSARRKLGVAVRRWRTGYTRMRAAG
jgi:RNA polymerase sigma-70 factor (ECF subfamily)